MLDMNIFLLKILKINMYNVHANFCNALTVQCYVLNLPSHLLQSLRACLSSFCDTTKYFSKPRILHESPHWWFGDPDSPFYKNILSEIWRSETCWPFYRGDHAYYRDQVSSLELGLASLPPFLRDQDPLCHYDLYLEKKSDRSIGKFNI